MWGFAHSGSYTRPPFSWRWFKISKPNTNLAEALNRIGYYTSL
jgi:hypothetical protein